MAYFKDRVTISFSTATGLIPALRKSAMALVFFRLTGTSSRICFQPSLKRSISLLSAGGAAEASFTRGWGAGGLSLVSGVAAGPGLTSGAAFFTAAAGLTFD